ncbi:unnamed protein product [Cuscuta europaea]|uniref:Uncharacterized protein n=1 Tax=Cuscuta europaea TaxID=41803 RepID=A0A9P0ZU39_CUSEU|nr:unnamed protein product [Cuscuta europaea]
MLSLAELRWMCGSGEGRRPVMRRSGRLGLFSSDGEDESHALLKSWDADGENGSHEEKNGTRAQTPTLEVKTKPTSAGTRQSVTLGAEPETKNELSSKGARVSNH